LEIMLPSKLLPLRRSEAGFTLPAILVVVSGLLILAVGILIVVGIERSTARSFSDRQRAGLAARAGLEDVRGILTQEAANDDFVILQGTEPVSGSKKDPLPYLYLARGSGGGNEVKFRYVPLFSTETFPPAGTPGSSLAAPKPGVPVGSAPKVITVLPWHDPAKISWIPIKDENGKLVSRYAYWVEDMQGKIDARISGNADGANGVHTRAAFPDPSTKPVKEGSTPLSAVAVHVLDRKATEAPLAAESGSQSLTDQIIAGRPAMLSPDSIIGATGILGNSTVGGGSPLLARDDDTGLLVHPVAAVLERDVSTVNQSYREQAIVPYAAGISKDLAGKPKLNLNKLLAANRSNAVDDFAARIESGLPDFEAKRKGGFPDNYLKTLAAGAMDYADEDNEPTVDPGVYVGIDSYPLLSEIVLHINFQGPGKVAGRHVLRWEFRLFAELWNMTNKPASGSARLSYEVNLKPESLALTLKTFPFDDPSILSDPNKSVHNLTKIDGKYFSPRITVTLRPDEYVFYEFASVTYTLDYTPQLDKSGQPIKESFDLLEPETEARGITLRWNDRRVETIQGIVRDAFGVSNFETTVARKAAKAAIPGHSYGPYGFFINNMGDPRIAHYLRTTRLGENAYPENISPGRRNIRRSSVYDGDTTGKEKRTHYGRVLPSEWPDGGHDSPTGAFTVTTNNATFPTDKTVWPTASMPTPLAENAPQRISNLGRFYSATELGRVYDPILWTSAYTDLKGKPGTGQSDTELLTRLLPKPNMPPSRNSWPEVSAGSVPNSDFGGGNTLRIGRPEHSRFDRPGERAAQLLDLFHAGIPASNDVAEREGDVIEIKGNVNVNTAGKDALRALAAGMLAQDPELCRVTNWEHDVSSLFHPKTTPLKLGTPTLTSAADKIADAIILRRPFASSSEMAAIKDKNDDPVFGNKDLYTDFKDIQWSDSAAEEAFDRVYDASTVRSRNFRVWVIGQCITGSETNPEILAEARKVFTVFSDPGERKSDGAIDPLKHIPQITYENDF
jgi:type II secretory pathway pseudopilin PulG